jgi:hypothetical protein
MKTALYAILLATLAAAQNPLARPDPYAGTFAGDGVTLELSGSAGVYTGALTVQGQRIAATVRTGGLDFALLKPIDTQFLVSLTKVDWSSFSNFAFACGLLAYSLMKLDYTPHWIEIALYPLYVLCGVLILYSLMIALAATSVSYTNATLHGKVNPNGGAATAYFEYGPTTGYGSQTPPVSVAGEAPSTKRVVLPVELSVMVPLFVMVPTKLVSELLVPE